MPRGEPVFAGITLGEGSRLSECPAPLSCMPGTDRPGTEEIDQTIKSKLKNTMSNTIKPTVNSTAIYLDFSGDVVADVIRYAGV